MKFNVFSQAWLLSVVLCILFFACTKTTNTETETASQQDTTVVAPEEGDAAYAESEENADGDFFEYDMVFDDWSEHKWVDERFFTKLNDTHNFDSAIAGNTEPVIIFSRDAVDGTKRLTKHSLHTFLATEEKSCWSNLSDFTDGTEKGRYLAVLNLDENYCDFKYLEAERIFGPGQKGEWLNVSYMVEGSAEKGQAYSTVASGKYRRVEEVITDIINRNLIVGKFTDDAGRSYEFYDEIYSEEPPEGSNDNYHIYKCDWQGDRYLYGIDVDDKGNLKLNVWNNEKDISKNYRAFTTSGTLMLHDDKSPEILKLTRAK